MSNHLEWPVRFEVTFCSVQGENHSYTICTWLNQEKAIAMAAERHQYLHRPQIYSVSVSFLGPAAQAESGVVRPVATDLIDRMEW